CRNVFQQCLDFIAGHEVGNARLPGGDEGFELGAEDDGSGFGVGVDVEFCRGGGVATAIDGGAHDGQLTDAGNDIGSQTQREGQVGQRPDHQDIDLFTGLGGSAESVDQITDAIGAGDFRNLGGARGATEAVFAVNILCVDDR